MSIFKKIPRWCYYAFPIAIILILFFALRGGGKALWSRLGSPSAVSVDPASAPALTPEKAEEKREEVKEVTEDKREKIKEEAAAMRERLNG